MTVSEAVEYIRGAAYRTTHDTYDTEIQMNLRAAEKDLGIAGVEHVTTDDALILRAITTYCAMHRVTVDPDDYDRLKKSYDEQKAQLQMSTGYTFWKDGGPDD